MGKIGTIDVRKARPPENCEIFGYFDYVAEMQRQRKRFHGHNQRPPRRHSTVYALLWLNRPSTSSLYNVLVAAGLHPNAIETRFHLTVYHARRIIPGLKPFRRHVSIRCDVAETRTMVLVPGGENPRPGVFPSHQSLALRLTRRNAAIPEIHKLRDELTAMETPMILGTRHSSTRNRNAFGARAYQPHIKICKPGNQAPEDLRIIGNHIRQELGFLDFDRYEVRIRPSSIKHERRTH